MNLMQVWVMVFTGIISMRVHPRNFSVSDIDNKERTVQELAFATSIADMTCDYIRNSPKFGAPEHREVQ